MARVEAEFRRLAEECFRLAQQTDAPDKKLLLLDMAQALADAGEQHRTARRGRAGRPAR